MSIAEQITQLKTDFDEVYDAGYEKGKAEGSGDSWYDTYWDSFQDNGNRRNYMYGFAGTGWTPTTFKPKYPIIAVGDAQYVFSNCDMTDLDFVENGIELDTKGATTLTYLFRQCQGVKRIGTIDCTGCKDLNRLFYGCSIETIDMFVVKESITYSATFEYANYLKNITISGKIGKSISFLYCENLTTGAEGEYMPDGITPSNSVQSIIDALITITDGVSRTIQFHQAVRDKLTPTQEDTIVNVKKWTLLPARTVTAE